MELRDYQARAVEDIERAFGNQSISVLAIAPCGAGKTVIAVEHIRRHEGDRVLCVVPRIELVRQMVRELRKAGIDPGVIAGPLREAPQKRVQVGTVQSLIPRDAGGAMKPDRIVLDECHHYEADTWRLMIERYPNVPRLGLTATPQRSTGEGLVRSFDSVVEVASYSELIKAGHLVPARLYQPRQRARGMAIDPVLAWSLYSEGRPTIVTVGRVEDAEQLALRFRTEAQISAECIDGETPRSLRKAVIEGFRAKKIQLLTNVYVLTEGFDVPDIGTIILARTFDFVGGYVQTVGRALRTSPGKRDATIVDLTGASLIHGAPDEDRTWNLEHEPVLRRDSTGDGGGGDPYYLPLLEGGVVRVRHGALPKDAPDPEPVPLKDSARGELLRLEHAAVDRKARQMIKRGKPAKAVMEWASAEHSRLSGRKAS